MALQSTTALATVTLQAASSTVTFSGIPNTYRDLILVFTGGVVSGSINVRLTLNGDSNNANYAGIQMSGTGSATSSTITINTESRYINYYGFLTADLNTQIVTTIFDYAQTDKHKTVMNRANNAGNGVTALVSRWASTTAVNTLEYSLTGSSFASGSTFSLYGRIA